MPHNIHTARGNPCRKGFAKGDNFENNLLNYLVFTNLDIQNLIPINSEVTLQAFPTTWYI